MRDVAPWRFCGKMDGLHLYSVITGIILHFHRTKCVCSAFLLLFQYVNF